MIRRKSSEMVDRETDFDHEMVVDGGETEFEQLFVDNGISDIF